MGGVRDRLRVTSGGPPPPNRVVAHIQRRHRLAHVELEHDLAVGVGSFLVRLGKQLRILDHCGRPQQERLAAGPLVVRTAEVSE